MKNNIIILLLLLLSINGFSKNSGFEYKGRRTPSVKKEKLKEVKFITDITPELWHKLILPYKEREELEYQRKMDYFEGYYLNPEWGYNIIIDYVSIEISAICNGKTLVSQSTNDKLTTEQKNILNAADLGSDISIKIKFNYKNKEKENPGSDNHFIEGKLEVTVVPETEAEYPGGFKQLTEYLTENVINKISDKRASQKLPDAIVKFTVNEEGKIVDVIISRTSEDLKTDKLILDAINKMPKWKPAQNPNGIKVKQEFSIPFGGDGC